MDFHKTLTSLGSELMQEVFQTLYDPWDGSIWDLEFIHYSSTIVSGLHARFNIR